VPLSQEEKERIMEEEAVRLEGRMKAHANLNLKGPHCSGAHIEDCPRCSQKLGCRGCRLWGWIFAAVVGLFLIHMICGRQDGACRWSRGDRGGMGWNGPQGDMDRSDAGAKGDARGGSQAAPSKP